LRPTKRVVFFSSAAVYGEDVHHPSITETTPVQPTSYYGLAKFTTERLLWKAVGRCAHQPLLILRPPLIYGPADPAGTYGPSGFVRAALRRDPVTLWGDGTEQREFLFIDDAVELVGRLMEQAFSGVVNLAAGCSVTFKEALEAVERLNGWPLQVTSRPRTKARVDNRFDNRVLRALVPGFTFTPLDEGIRRAWEAERRAETPEPMGADRA
jgi:UDP-glucose 4-epimerase